MWPPGTWKFTLSCLDFLFCRLDTVCSVLEDPVSECFCNLVRSFRTEGFLKS
ncbi:hypothetical protein LINGRAHAP2_LOCUS31928 [Linum grandiflorum]